MEATKVDDAEVVYNPKSSFFDNISCEGKGGRNEGMRRTGHEMRTADAETFGSESVGEVRLSGLLCVVCVFVCVCSCVWCACGVRVCVRGACVPVRERCTPRHVCQCVSA